MKLVISYDLPDKIKEAKTGFSLKRCSKRVLFYTGVNAAIVFPINALSAENPDKYLIDLLAYLGCHSTLTAFNQAIMSDIYKKMASSEIDQLSQTIKQINVNASCDELLQAQPYKTEYNFDFKTGSLEQKKYINISVNDIWGERDVSIMQEHIFGSKDYILSLGTPEEKKIYSFGSKKMIKK